MMYSFFYLLLLFSLRLDFSLTSCSFTHALTFFVPFHLSNAQSFEKYMMNVSDDTQMTVQRCEN